MVRDLLQLNTLYKRFFIACVGILVAGCAIYGILLKETVGSVVARRAQEAERADLAARVSVLEARYIALGHDLNLAKAHSLGFVNVKPKTFISRSPQALSFDYSNEE